MAELAQNERLAAVAALGDPVRRALYELLQRSEEPLSRDQLAEAVGIPRSTTSFQLGKMVDGGLLFTEFRKLGDRTGPGSGRPAKLYAAAEAELSASVPDRHYDLAARLLAGAIEKSIQDGRDVQESLADVAFEAGARLGAEAGTIASVLAAVGYQPEPDGAGGYVLANCPFHRLAKSHTVVVCGLNGALLNGALHGCGDIDHQVLPDPDGPYCCARIPRNQTVT